MSAGVTFADRATLYGADLAVGANHGIFGDVSLGQISYSDLSGKSTAIGATVGYGLHVASNTEFCPFVAYTHTAFPDLGSPAAPITSHEDNIGFGGAIGMRAVMSPTFSFVPNLSLQYIHATATSSSAAFGSSSTSEDWGALGLGVGMVINQSVTFQPGVSIPLGLQGGKTSVSLALGFNFGHIQQP